MRIGIIIAMDSEYESIKKILKQPRTIRVMNRTFLEGTYGKNTLIVCTGGIGKVNAAITATLMDMSFDCSLIINTGCAGGLSESLSIGDIVVGTDYRYHDVWCPLTPDTKKGELQGLPYIIEASKIKKNFDVTKWDIFKFGHFFTGDQFIETKETCTEITKDVEDKQPCVCDMESMAIAHLCYQHNIDFMSFRVISDVPCYHSDADEHLKEYEDFWNVMSDKSYKFLKGILDSYIGE